jgi:hypothetical protein
MSVRTATLTFNFLDPVECLIRLLTVGPLSADMGNMAFTPRLNHSWYDGLLHPKCMSVWVCYVCNLCLILCVRYEDFVDGDRLKRVYAALRPGSSALTAVLFFDSINRDKKGDTYIYIYFVFLF